MPKIFWVPYYFYTHDILIAEQLYIQLSLSDIFVLSSLGAVHLWHQHFLGHFGPPPLSACVRFLRPPPTRNEIIHSVGEIHFLNPWLKKRRTSWGWVVPSSIVWVEVELSWDWVELNLSWSWNWVKTEIGKDLNPTIEVFEVFNWSIWSSLATLMRSS